MVLRSVFLHRARMSKESYTIKVTEKHGLVLPEILPWRNTFDVAIEVLQLLW